MPYLRNYKEFEGEILDLQLGKYGLSFETKKYTTSGWAQGDENVIGIRAFNLWSSWHSIHFWPYLKHYPAFAANYGEF